MSKKPRHSYRIFRVETKEVAETKDFATREAAEKWVADRQDSKQEGVEYQIWSTEGVPAVPQS